MLKVMVGWKCLQARRVSKRESYEIIGQYLLPAFKQTPSTILCVKYFQSINRAVTPQVAFDARWSQLVAQVQKLAVRRDKCLTHVDGLRCLLRECKGNIDMTVFGSSK